MTLTITDHIMTSDRTAHTARLAPGRQHAWQVSWLPGRFMDRAAATTAMMLADTAATGLDARAPPLAAHPRLGRRTRPDHPRRDHASVRTPRENQQRGTGKRPGRPGSSRAMSAHHPRHRRHPEPPDPGGTTPATARSPATPQTGPPGPDPAPERLAYSVDEAARLTGLSRDLLYDQMRRGNLAYIKVGRRRLITRQHLQQFLEIAS